MYFIQDSYEFMYVFVCMYVNFVSFCCRGRSGGVARGGEVTEQERSRITSGRRRGIGARGRETVLNEKKERKARKRALEMKKTKNTPPSSSMTTTTAGCRDPQGTGKSPMKCLASLSQEKLALVKIEISLIPHHFVIVGTKKRKMEGEKSSGPIENSEIESEQLEKTETSSSPKECWNHSKMWTLQ